jgi:hypothetical protein
MTRHTLTVQIRDADKRLAELAKGDEHFQSHVSVEARKPERYRPNRPLRSRRTRGSRTARSP